MQKDIYFSREHFKLIEIFNFVHHTPKIKRQSFVFRMKRDFRFEFTVSLNSTTWCLVRDVADIIPYLQKGARRNKFFVKSKERKILKPALFCGALLAISRTSPRVAFLSVEIFILEYFFGALFYEEQGRIKCSRNTLGSFSGISDL